jgi:hypothetical protein
MNDHSIKPYGKKIALIFCFTAPVFCFTAPAFATGLPFCMTAALTTYTTGGPNSCAETGGVTIAFNQTVLPSYAGLSILSGESAANPAAITAVPGTSTPGMDFQSSTFKETTAVLDPLAVQAELVQFDVSAATGLTSTTFNLDNAQVTGPGLGAGVAIGQELVCVGGNFTSLPTGLVTSVVNGVLGTGNFGCNGTVLVGTAGSEIGLLTAVTSLVNLPNITGLGDSATIQLAPYNTTTIDVIKIQALLGVAGGSAQTTGFGDTFAANVATPEPGGMWIGLTGLLLISLSKVRLTNIKYRGEKSDRN